MRLAAIAAVLFCFSTFISATTFTVKQDGSGDFTSIQAAIDAAAETATIIVAPGTYHESVTVAGKDITLTSTDPNNPDIVASTVINGRVIAQIGEERATYLYIDGFQITGATDFAINFDDGGHGEVHHCRIINNSGDGILIYGKSIAVADCVISNNSGNGIDLNYVWSTNSLVKNCIISNNSEYGIFCNASGPLVENCQIRGNSGGIVCQNDSYPEVRNCKISDNTGCGVETGQGGPKIFNSVLSNNGSHGVDAWCQDALELTNCLVMGNGGDGVQIRDAEYPWIPYIKNCTITSNVGYGVSFHDVIMVSHFSNSVIWDNSSGSVDTASMRPDYGEPDFRYCDIQGGWLGTGNIDADPLFANPDANDFHLKSQAGRWDSWKRKWVYDDVTSPCIDAGDPDSSIGSEPNPNGGRINMGAYGGTSEASKSYCPNPIDGDINGDCRVDFKDFAIMASHWLENSNL